MVLVVAWWQLADLDVVLEINAFYWCSAMALDQSESLGIPEPVDASQRFTFPPWANYLLPAAVIVAFGVLTYIPVLLSVSLSPTTTDVGYQPVQPIAFSHAQHAGDLKIDCRYCHSTVAQTSFASVPSTAVCMNCHASIKSDSPNLLTLRDRYADGGAIPWIKVHDLPDFVYFNHSAHVNQGVGCTSCHGKIDQMPEVYQHEPISMGWCLDCHRNPEQHLRPRSEITNMNWDAQTALGKTQSELGQSLKGSHSIRSMDFLTSCTTCHR